MFIQCTMSLIELVFHSLVLVVVGSGSWFQIEYVEKCCASENAAKSPRKTQICSQGTLTYSRSTVHMDSPSTINGKQFMPTVGAFSKCSEVRCMKSTSAKATVDKLQQVFTCFESSEVLVSDNGTQSTSESLKFCIDNAVKNIKTFPIIHSQTDNLRDLSTLKKTT